MKNLMRSGRAHAFITPDGTGYAVVAEWDVTAEEIQAAIDAEEELERYRGKAMWN